MWSAPNLTYFQGTPPPAVPSASTTSFIQSLKSQHVGGVHILLGDGSVRFLSENISLVTLRNLADMTDGTVIGEF
ncbi:MAG: hypothetical protein JWN70_5618 [Planctomycetaceae bacterium]|nr:hypothetical protein [Planctomycetaceae bacterium]